MDGLYDLWQSICIIDSPEQATEEEKTIPAFALDTYMNFWSRFGARSTFYPLGLWLKAEIARSGGNVLAAVAGHPFITTLVTTFSDDQSLYMLVCPQPPYFLRRECGTECVTDAFLFSWNTALVAKSSAIYASSAVSTSMLPVSTLLKLSSFSNTSTNSKVVLHIEI